MRLIQQGESVMNIKANISKFLNELGKDSILLKQLFGQTRDQWIQQIQCIYGRLLHKVFTLRTLNELQIQFPLSTRH
jgi:DNA integrity scanning protein DisA with diadenylate cyclase activity